MQSNDQLLSWILLIGLLAVFGAVTRWQSNKGKILRSRNERIVAGVCAGVAKRGKISPNLIRFFFVLASLNQGIGVLMYIILWVAIHEEAPYDPFK